MSVTFKGADRAGSAQPSGNNPPTPLCSWPRDQEQQQRGSCHRELLLLSDSLMSTISSVLRSCAGNPINAPNAD